MTPQEFAKKQRDFLIKTEKQSAVVLLAEFENLKKNINQYLTTNLTGTISITKIKENSFLERTLETIEGEITRIVNPFARIVTRGQNQVINFAAKSLQKFLGIKTSIFEVDTEARQQLIGRTQTGTTLGKFFERLKPAVRQKAKETLIEGFTLGESNQVIAKRLSEVADIARHRALTISRTEQNEAYRAATRDFYAEAEIIEYIWMSVLDPRTCLICWHLHGRIFKSNKKIFSHPNCRCVLIPKTKNHSHITTGAERFATLEIGFQKQILGGKRFELFQNGGKLDDFVEVKKSKEFGERFLIKKLR